MPIFVARFLLAVRGRLRGWRTALAVLVFVFATSWLAMWFVEPSSNAVTDPGNYWWWFLVTGSTVGYGDFYPESGFGHLVGAYVLVGSVVALTILFTEVAGRVQAMKGKRMRGAVELDVSGHIVILGYTAGRTERIVDELRVEERAAIVLCVSEEIAEHPMPEREVLFVRGDLSSADVLTRACVERAATVVIDAHDDNEALTLAVAVDHLRPDVHMVAALRDMARCVHLRYVNPKVQCVQWHMPNLLTEEALDPGVTEVYTEMMSSAGASNTYSVRLPEQWAGVSFGECQTRFGQRFRATVIAVRQNGGIAVGPAWDAPLRAGAVLYYLAGERLDERRLASLGG